MAEVLFARLDEMLAAVANLQAQITAIVPIDNPNIIALSNLDATTGLLSQTAAATFTKRTLTGTAAQITVTNGNGVAGNPVISLPTAITLTGITLTGGTFAGPTMTAPMLGTPASGVATNLTGTAAGLTAGNVTNNANLTGDVTSVGNATTLTNAPVIAKVLTGYVSGAGVVAATDSILVAIQKLNGNDATNANLTGDVTSVGNATTLTNAPVIAKVLTGYVSGAGVLSATDSILAAIQKLNGNDATNANLTGPITSSGNATSIASQTGTGSTFVMSAGPTITGTLSSGPHTITSATSTAIAVGANGVTNPALQVDASAATSATGLLVQAEASGSNLNLSVTSPATNENIIILPKGTGFAQFGVGLRSSLGTGVVNGFIINPGTTGNPVELQANDLGGTGNANIDLQLTPKGSGMLKMGNAGSFLANGVVATVLGSLGPTGSHTTVQEWFTIKDSAGTIRYIPAF